jgi:cell division protein FtsQ
MSKTPAVKFSPQSKLSYKRKARLWIGRFLFTWKILIAILLYLFFFTSHMRFIKEYIQDNFAELGGELGFRLETVVIRGNKHIDTNTIVSSLNADVGTPLFSISLDKIYHKLKNISWVQDVTLQRKLPDMIIINILERKPIAIWQNKQKLSLVDADGNVIATDKIGDFAFMLHVVGEDAHIHASSLIEGLKLDPAISANVISAVRYGERRWNLILKQNITVKMPERDFDVALKYLAKMHQQNKLFDQNYKTIDLRDSTKYYIEKM